MTEPFCELTLAKDPNAPKRGLSAYMFFANEQRDNVREENPGITFGEYDSLSLARMIRCLLKQSLLNGEFTTRSSWQSPW